ncbi:MAG TPA: hypothetical protein VH396_04740, partial [Chitinophagaceae bacterium]
DKACEKIQRWRMGYHIVATAYVWNNLFEAAADIHENFLYTKELWEIMRTEIYAYLELLMIKKQKEQIRKIFSNMEFRKKFVHHYDVYVSLFIDDTYPLTNTLKCMAIFNRINNAQDVYR